MKFCSQEESDIKFLDELIHASKKKSFEDILEILYSITCTDICYSEQDHCYLYNGKTFIQKPINLKKLFTKKNYYSYSVYEETALGYYVQYEARIDFKHLQESTLDILISYLNSIFDWLRDLIYRKYEREQIFVDILAIFQTAMEKSTTVKKNPEMITLIHKFGEGLLNRFKDIYYNNPQYDNFKRFISRMNSGINPTGFRLKMPTKQKSKQIFLEFQNCFLISDKINEESFFSFISGDYPEHPIDLKCKEKLFYLFKFIEAYNTDDLLYSKRGNPYKRCTGIFTCNGQELPNDWNRNYHKKKEDGIVIQLKELIKKLN